jgi:hypothetical protein
MFRDDRQISISYVTIGRSNLYRSRNSVVEVYHTAQKRTSINAPNSRHHWPTSFPPRQDSGSVPIRTLHARCPNISIAFPVKPRFAFQIGYVWISTMIQVGLQARLLIDIRSRFWLIGGRDCYDGWYQFSRLGGASQQCFCLHECFMSCSLQVKITGVHVRLTGLLKDFFGSIIGRKQSLQRNFWLEKVVPLSSWDMSRWKRQIHSISPCFLRSALCDVS